MADQPSSIAGGAFEKAKKAAKKKGEAIEHPVYHLLSFGIIAGRELAEKALEQGTTPDKSEIQPLLDGIEFMQEMREKMDGGDWSFATLAVGEGVGEVFGSRLARKAGLLAPEVKLNAYRDCDEQYYWKKVPGGYVGSQKIYRALPVYFIEVKDKTIPAQIRYIMSLEWTWGFPKYNGRFRRPEPEQNAMLRSLLVKTNPLSRKHYDDFSEADEKNPAILKAAHFEAPERLKFHALSCLLHKTYFHSSNLLVDHSANLWGIDYATMLFADGTDDLDKLAVVVKRSEKLKTAFRQICQITEKDIHECLSEIPARYWQDGVFNDKDSAAKYFITRLKRYVSLFAE